jgi:hypothetical protein
MPAAARWIASLTPTRWAYAANLLQEAKYRTSTFTNELEQKLLGCQNGVASCQAPTARVATRRPPDSSAATGRARTETDLAAAAFPVVNGRTSVALSFQILGTFFATFTLLDRCAARNANLVLVT